MSTQQKNHSMPPTRWVVDRLTNQCVQVTAASSTTCTGYESLQECCASTPGLQGCPVGSAPVAELCSACQD
jgi:hypothetical protein